MIALREEQDQDLRRSSDLALVLSGGGARAAYQVGVLMAVADRAPGVSIPIITGVSAGAINAAFLAGYRGSFRDAVWGLRGEWERLTSRRIYHVRFSSLVRSGVNWLRQIACGWCSGPPVVKGLFDTRPLRRFLAESIDFAGIDANIEARRLRAVALSATSYGAGSVTTFVHGASDIPMWRRFQRAAVTARLTLDHVMASAAIPIVFPAVRLNGGFHGDGSVRQAYPLSPAIHLGARRILAIAAGPTPSDITDPCPSCEYPSAAEAIGLLLDSIFLDALDADAESLLRINRLLQSSPLPAESPGGLRPIDLLLLRPSRDLGSIAGQFSGALPPMVRFLVGGTGAKGRGGGDFLSYLLFEPPYTSRLIELGYADTCDQWPSIKRFLAWEASPRPR